MKSFCRLAVSIAGYSRSKGPSPWYLKAWMGLRGNAIIEDTGALKGLADGFCCREIPILISQNTGITVFDSRTSKVINDS